MQTHVTYASPRRWWVSVGAGYDWGGETTINGERKDDARQDFLLGISAGFAVSPSSSIKIAYVRSRTQEDIGQDTDSVGISYLTRFQGP